MTAGRGFAGATRCWVPGLVILLAGCAAAPMTTIEGETARYRQRAETLTGVDSWAVTGRIAFRIEEEGGTGAMNWQQTGRSMRFSFRGPLGAGAFNLAGAPPDLVLETGESESYRLADPEAELRARYGWSAPFASLRYWMIGLPDPVTEARLKVDDEGLLRSLDQSGWAVSYDSYHAQSPRLPRKLTMTREGVRIRVVIDFWRLDPPRG